MGLKDKYYEFKDKHFRKDFFISYHNSPGKGENCVAKKIHQVLKRKCYSDYYNPEHFEFNEQYAERLHRKVKECKVFIWLIILNCVEKGMEVLRGTGFWQRYFGLINIKKESVSLLIKKPIKMSL